MKKSYKGIFDKFYHMAMRLKEEGTTFLEKYLDYGDWYLFFVNRKILDERKLSPEDQLILNQIDKDII